MSVRESPTSMVLDVEGTLDRFGGDKDLFAELAGFLLKDLPPLFSELRNAVSSADAPGIRHHAHALKGLVAGCGGVRAAHVAQSLENAGQEGNVSHASSLISSLETELEQLTEALRRYCDKNKKSSTGAQTSHGSPST